MGVSPCARPDSEGFKIFSTTEILLWRRTATGMCDTPVRRSPRCRQPHDTPSKPRRGGSSPEQLSPHRKKPVARKGPPRLSSTSVSPLIYWHSWTGISTGSSSRRDARPIAASLLDEPWRSFWRPTPRAPTDARWRGHHARRSGPARWCVPWLACSCRRPYQTPSYAYTRVLAMTLRIVC